MEKQKLPLTCFSFQGGVKNSQGDLNTEKEAKAIIAEKMIFMWCI